MEVVCDHIIPQSDRDSSHRIPIVPFIDQRLLENKIDGYRYENMPSDQEAHRLGLRAIDETAWRLHGVEFTGLSALHRDEILKSVHDGNPLASHEIWERLPVHRYWMLLVQDCIEVYYAHPWAWDEIGYGGPAYPRAYMRLERGQAEPWEVDERRYEWEPPATSVSDDAHDIQEMLQHDATPGQGGTH
jgi:Gluconate 2-dehydrogenase subunit 3